MCDLSRLLDDLVGFDAIPFVFGLLPMMLGSFGKGVEVVVFFQNWAIAK